jgi:hypothetical protein
MNEREKRNNPDARSYAVFPQSSQSEHVSSLLSDEFLLTLKSLALFHFHFIVGLRSGGSLYPDLSN